MVNLLHFVNQVWRKGVKRGILPEPELFSESGLEISLRVGDNMEPRTIFTPVPSNHHPVPYFSASFLPRSPVHNIIGKSFEKLTPVTKKNINFWDSIDSDSLLLEVVLTTELELSREYTYSQESNVICFLSVFEKIYLMNDLCKQEVTGKKSIICRFWSSFTLRDWARHGIPLELNFILLLLLHSFH